METQKKTATNYHRWHLRAAEEIIGKAVEKEEVIIIGDTPKDIECAAANGIDCLAVATGNFSIEELGTHQPTHLLEDLSNTTAVLKIIEGEN